MGNVLTLTIDDRTVEVPEGTLVVDAAKKVGIDIPVFCYHPKLKPVGMCRMCLVEIGRPVIDRATGEKVCGEDGLPQIRFGPKLDTACTTPVVDGMIVITNSEKVSSARKDIVEFILTSHPLDCPICDKGGECPLQNLTMGFGPGESRFIYDEKMHLSKHYPLGELIFLDRERCIQCGRCVRFQDEVVDDPVIGFSQRGRALQIMTNSDPGFDSIFSGNTTDICPVGALTTSDFRFGARPWELKYAASICNHCPVGCNITFNVRREAKSGGRSVIKRIMPRQNEEVNEIWTCDKGRLVYHYTESEERLSQPYIRKNGQLEPAGWDEALELVAQKLKSAGEGLVGLVGGRLSNEDLFNIKKVIKSQNGKPVLYSYMAGGDLVAQLGVPPGTDFSTMGKETAILVVASDLHQEAPIWWLQVKQAAQRGAKLIVANPRPTRLDEYASFIVRYQYGQEPSVVSAFLPEGEGFMAEYNQEAAHAFTEAENVVIMYGSEGMGLSQSQALSKSAANLLVNTGHFNRKNNGLIGIWPNGNLQGAFDMGFCPENNLDENLSSAGAVYIAAADPAGDNPGFVKSLQTSSFVVVQELFMTPTAELADVVLPVQAYTEREGTFTNGERRVQRYHLATTAKAGLKPDYGVAAQIGKKMGVEDMEETSPALIMLQIAESVPAYAGLNYQKLAEVKEQWPIIGRSDLYYGGTAYDNHQGLGIQLSPKAASNDLGELGSMELQDAIKIPGGSILVVPVNHLYDQGSLMVHSTLLSQRMVDATISMHPDLAENYGVQQDDEIHLILENLEAPVLVRVCLDESLPHSAALIPRSVGVPLQAPAPAKIKKLVPEG